MDSNVRLLLLIGTLMLQEILAENDEFMSPRNATCACPNENLIFTCTTVGSGSTIWRVTAFDCTQNEIILRHSEFDDVGGTSGVCNGGGISGRSIEVEGNRYTSQLILTVSPELHNQTVTCLLNSNGVRTTIRDVSIIVASELYQGAPSGVKLTNVIAMNELNFSWNPVNPDCSPDYQNIMFGCGRCQSASATTATCIDLQIPSTCDFSVQNVVCGEVGSPSDPISVTLRVPNKPNVTFVPVYSADTGRLIRFDASVQQEALFNITDGVSGSVIAYNFSYSGMTTQNPSCGDSRCDYNVEITPIVCSQSTSINVSLSALNRLGLGPSSNPTTIGCENQFVLVQYNSDASAIICQFTTSTNISKSCSVSYGQCNQLMDFTQSNSTLNIITLNINSDSFECYTVTASIDEFTIVVEGRRSTSSGNDNTLIAIILPIVIILITILITIVVAAVVFKIVKEKEKSEELNIDKDHFGDSEEHIQKFAGSEPPPLKIGPFTVRS